MYTLLDLFAGIGGFSFAASFLDIHVTDAVEINPFCQQVFRKHFPHANIHSDVTTYRGILHSHDILTAGSPCQNFSLAGDRTGINGDKSKLILEFFRILGEVQPQGFVFENVPGAHRYLPEILSEIAQIGLYELRWFSLSVDVLGGAHRRNRLFIVGKTTSANITGVSIKTPGNQINQAGANPSFKCGLTSAWSGGETQPRLADRIYGIPPRLASYLMPSCNAHQTILNSLDTVKKSDRAPKIEALGNSVTPQQAYIALSLLIQWLSDDS